jgi:pyruvate formate lyase activating enzyme
MTGRIHSYETFGAADGPGVRFVVFMHGCPFHCRYCHNPDTWAGGRWAEAEPREVLSRALRYRAYWGEEGGITVSGGEPMMQSAFVADLFELAHAQGVNTCLDTAAGPFDPASPDQSRLFAACDTVLLDIKHIDPVAHLSLVGASNAAPLACARRLADLGVRVWIRHVLVPGVTDSEDDLRRLADFIATLSNVERVDVLPYHSMGEEKWRMLGVEYTLGGVRPPDEASLARARALLGG